MEQSNTIEVCLGVGMNQIFPEYITIEILPISDEGETSEIE